MSHDSFVIIFLLVYVPVAALIFFFLLSFILSVRSEGLSAYGKAVLISGCDSGIGLRVAEDLYDKGFHVLAACLNTGSPGAHFLQDKKRFPDNRMIVLPLDITSKESISAVVASVKTFLSQWQMEGMLQVWVFPKLYAITLSLRFMGSG